MQVGLKRKKKKGIAFHYFYYCFFLLQKPLSRNGGVSRLNVELICTLPAKKENHILFSYLIEADRLFFLFFFSLFLHTVVNLINK